MNLCVGASTSFKCFKHHPSSSILSSWKAMKVDFCQVRSGKKLDFRGICFCIYCCVIYYYLKAEIYIILHSFHSITNYFKKLSTCCYFVYMLCYMPFLFSLFGIAHWNQIYDVYTRHWQPRFDFRLSANFPEIIFLGNLAKKETTTTGHYGQWPLVDLEKSKIYAGYTLTISIFTHTSHKENTLLFSRFVCCLFNDYHWIQRE